MNSKTSFLSIALYTFLCTSLFAQNREIIALDRYFRPLTEKEDPAHLYNKVISQGKDSIQLEKIFDLQNRMLRSTRYGFNSELGYNELIEEQFDTLKNRISVKYLNLDNGKYQHYYFKNGEQVSSLGFDGVGSYELIVKDNPETIITDYYPFTLTPKFTDQERTDFYMKNLKYPSQARNMGEQGTVILKHVIGIDGKVITREAINKDPISQLLVNETIRLSEQFDPEFYPVYSIYGEKIESVYRWPTRFKLSNSSR